MINFTENKDLETLNHSCAHMMAHAIQHIWPNAKFWVGPVVEEGFYYDVDLGDVTLGDDDLKKIEKEMKKIAKDGKKIVCIPMKIYYRSMNLLRSKPIFPSWHFHHSIL